ncbi:MAG: methyltransferase family protein [Sciscionella sp.]
MEWEGVSFGISLLGLIVRIATVGFVTQGSSGRETKSLRAEIFNTTGMYSVVRHPLYLGNFLVALGILFDDGTWYIVTIGSLIYWLYYERIMVAEEGVLAERHGDAFRTWAASTPAFIPRFSQWRPPLVGFSVRTAIRREYATFFMIICVFTALEVADDYEVLHHIHFDPLWGGVFLSSVTFYLVTRFLAKRTKLLEVPGR